jgi:Ca2+-binding EF-hand superfamily protein
MEMVGCSCRILVVRLLRCTSEHVDVTTTHSRLVDFCNYHVIIGTIELNELQQVMRKLGQNPSEAELREMIHTVDDNGDEEIDFEEFLILMKSRIGERDPEKELRDAFAVFDTDGSGSIDRKELKRLMKKLGQALSEAELDAMMDEVDTNGDGEISFAEFKAMMVSWCTGECNFGDDCLSLAQFKFYLLDFAGILSKRHIFTHLKYLLKKTFCSSGQAKSRNYLLLIKTVFLMQY